MIAELAHTVTDRCACGLGSAGDEQADLVHDRCRRQRVPIDLGMQPERNEIVGGAGHLVLGDLAERSDEFHIRVDELNEGVPVALAHINAHEALAPTLEFTPHRLGITEQATREPRWQLTGQRIDQLALTRVDNVIDQLGDKCIDLSASISNGCSRECVLHQHALLAMARIVLRNHVDLVGCPNRAVALAAEIHAAAPFDLHQIGVSGDTPQPVAMVSIDRLVGSHPRERIVGITAVELRVKQIDNQAIVGHCSHDRDLVTSAAGLATPALHQRQGQGTEGGVGGGGGYCTP